MNISARRSRLTHVGLFLELPGLRLLCALLASLQVLLPSLAAALPTDGHVVAGQAIIQNVSPTTLSVTQISDKAILNWNSFSIAANEAVRFHQPSMHSIALNRVIGVDPSVILGQLQANGRIFLINPNGILFGAGAQINVGGLLATTLQIRDDDFMAGRYLFAQDPLKGLNTVVNRGTIHVSDNGYVVLMAPGVSNEGVIVANLGTALLGSGQKFTLDLMGDGLIRYAINDKVLRQVIGPNGKPLSSAVSNSGTIQADGGQVILSARASGDVFSSVVNQSGVIRAQSLVNHGGVVRLEGSDPVANTGTVGWQANLGKVQNADGTVLNTGTIDVSAAGPGAAQGQVTITGEMVGIAGTILARGAEGAQGGRVLISSTDKTVATSDSVINTSGVGNSSAGNVVVWSDKNTMFGGTILAQGGALGGNGGFVEVSGKESLMFSGLVNALAPRGQPGTLLLDPRNIVVATAGGVAYNPGVNNLFGNNLGATTTITPASINGQLANVVLQANTDITVTNAIAMTNAGVGITMQAGRSIAVNANVSTTNGNISLTANDATATAADRLAGAGNMTMAAGTTLSSGTGNISLTMGSSVAVPFSPGSITTVGNLTTTTGNISINSPNTVSLSGALNAGSGTVTINANTDGAGAQAFTMNAGSSITTTNTTAGAVQINVNAAGGGTGTAALDNITVPAAGTLTVDTNTGGNLTGGAITQNAGTSLIVGTAQLSTGNGAITLNNAGNDFGTVAVSGGTNVTLQDVNALILGASTVSGTLGVTTNGALTQSGSLTVTGTTTLAAGAANNITLNNAANDFSTVGVTTGLNVSLTDANALDLGASTISGTLGVTTGGALTQTGALTVAGATTLVSTVANSDILLNTQANNFTGAVSFGGVQTNLRDVGLRNINAGATVPLLAGLTNLRNLTLTFDTAPVTLPALTASGNLLVTAGGAITDSGNLAIIGTTTLTAGANNITLDNANNFTGAVSVTSGNNVTLNDINALILGASTISGTLNVTTAGALTQSGAVSVVGTTTLAAGAGNNITLNNAANDFSTVGITNGNNVALTDANALDLAASIVNGTLNVTAGGLISQSGALTVAGNASFNTTAAPTLGSVSLTNGGALTLATSTVGGNLTATTTAGDITLPLGQTLTVAGDATLTPAGNVNLLGTTQIGGTQTLNGGTGSTFVLAADTNLNALALPAAGNITVNLTGTKATFAGAPLLPAAMILFNAGNNFGGTVSVTSASPAFTGTVTNTYNLTQSAAVTLNPGQGLTATDLGGTAGTRGNITLPNAGNTFNTVTFTGGDIAWQQANAITIGSVRANARATSTGALTITATGSITQTGAVVAAGTTTLAAGAGNNITLNNAGNDFSTVGITSGNNVILNDINALILGASTISGTLDVTTAGALTQSGAVSVVGTTTLAAGAGNNITLNNAANDFSTVGITNGNNVA
jgi:filamentous hemagglutinin family protein